PAGLRRPTQVAQRDARGRQATETVYTSARRRRRRAEVDAAQRRSPRQGSQGWTGNELTQRVRAADDVAADVVSVVSLEAPRRHDVSGEDQLADPGREALDLPL